MTLSPAEVATVKLALEVLVDACHMGAAYDEARALLKRIDAARSFKSVKLKGWHDAAYEEID